MCVYVCLVFFPFDLAKTVIHTVDVFTFLCGVSVLIKNKAFFLSLIRALRRMHYMHIYSYYGKFFHIASYTQDKRKKEREKQINKVSFF